VYVSDTWNHRVQVFTTDGTFLRQWGEQGSRVEQFWVPCGIAVDASGNVYTVDHGNNRIQIFAPGYPTPDPVFGLSLNGSFEETPDLVHWAYGGEQSLKMVDTAHHGNRAARLGAPVSAEPQPYGKAWLRQTVYVRPEWTEPKLTFHYRMYVNDIVDYSDFHVWLSTPIGAWLADVLRDGYTHPENYPPSPGHDMGWRRAEYDLSVYKGQHVRLIFENRNLHHNLSLGIWTIVDDVRVVDAGP
jgi:hypothetical protein